MKVMIKENKPYTKIWPWCFTANFGIALFKVQGVLP